MRLRQLKISDAEFMLEWMKDESVNRFFQFDANSVTMDSVIGFINSSLQDTNSVHFAVASDEDEYLGTVSLKNIDYFAKKAEYAISLRRAAQRIGAGRFATSEILAYAFNHLNLERVYLNVLANNERAVAFYEKFGFVYEGEFYNHLYIKGSYVSLKWFRMMKNEFYEIMSEGSLCIEHR